MSEQLAVLLMAYGGPDKLEDVEPYLLDVRGGRETASHIIEEVRHRYQLIGGRSPILERTQDQAQALRAALDELSGQFKVFVGMRHWHPFLRETLAEITEAGLSKLVGLVMAPHYSKMSVQAYYDRLQKAIEQGGSEVEVAPIHSWHLDAGYLQAVEERIERGLERFPAAEREQVQLVFTAHSLPERILQWEDPYPHQLDATFESLRNRFPAQYSHFAYQSAAMTPEPWLGPDAGDLMEEMLRTGQARRFLVVPIGFVSEHVEILYDIDIEFRERIEEAGGKLERVEMPGADRRMMASLAQRVAGAAQERQWL